MTASADRPATIIHIGEKRFPLPSIISDIPGKPVTMQKYKGKTEYRERESIKL